MWGWGSAAWALGASRSTKATASGKPANVNCFRMASPSSVQPVSVSRRSWASVFVSFMRDLFCTNVVEPETRRFDRLERFLLQLDRGRPLGGIRECAAGDRSMIRAFRLLQRRQCGRVLVLPGQPLSHALDRFSVGPAGAVDPESFARRSMLGPGSPLAAALHRHDAIP